MAIYVKRCGFCNWFAYLNIISILITFSFSLFFSLPLLFPFLRFLSSTICFPWIIIWYQNYEYIPIFLSSDALHHNFLFFNLSFSFTYLLSFFEKIYTSSSITFSFFVQSSSFFRPTPVVNQETTTINRLLFMSATKSLWF